MLNERSHLHYIHQVSSILDGPNWGESFEDEKTGTRESQASQTNHHKREKNGYHNTSIIILLAKAVQQQGGTCWNTKKKLSSLVENSSYWKYKDLMLKTEKCYRS